MINFDKKLEYHERQCKKLVMAINILTALGGIVVFILIITQP